MTSLRALIASMSTGMPPSKDPTAMAAAISWARARVACAPRPVVPCSICLVSPGRRQACCGIQASPAKRRTSMAIGSRPCLIAVEMYERTAARRSAPSIDRKQDEIFL